MAHISLAHQGLAALEASRWEEAVDKLSRALQSSISPTWLVARSKALNHLGRSEQALEDANLAWHTAFQRNQRRLMAEAHYRRAVAYYRLGQYANADCCCIYAMRLMKGLPAVEAEDPNTAWLAPDGTWAASYQQAADEAQLAEPAAGSPPADMAADPKPAQARAWEQASEWRLASAMRLQSLRAMEKLPPTDRSRKLTVCQQPDKNELATLGLATAAKEADGLSTGAGAASAAATARPDAKPRMQDFQTDSTVTVTIFSKGVSKEKLKVDFQPSCVRLEQIVYPDGQLRELQIPLWGQIAPAACRHSVTPMKVELSLAKAPAARWPRIVVEAAPCRAVGQAQGKDGGEERAPPAGSEPAAPGPAYPSSSRSGPKNWDKIGAEEVGDGDDDGDDNGGDVNIFFKKLFKNATPEQKRAMMKSFTESNGTALSTDWDDVKSRVVETVPPEGVEAKKWT